MDLAVNRENSSIAALDLAGCTPAVFDWLLHNSISLHQDKSEAIGTMQRVQSLQNLVPISVSGTPISLATHITSLEVDTHLSFDQYVRDVCKRATATSTVSAMCVL